MPLQHFDCLHWPWFGGLPSEPSSINALIILNLECKISLIIGLSILRYIQDPDIPQSHLVIHMLFSLSSVDSSSYQTSIPSNINLLCPQVFTYTLNTGRPGLFELAKEVDSWRISRFLLMGYLIQVFVLKLSSKESLVREPT